MKKLFKLSVIVTEMVVLFWSGWFIHQQLAPIKYVEVTEHPKCYDNKKQLAYIAFRKDEWRCFMVGRDYPHRVQQSYIDKEDYSAIEQE